MSLSPVFHASRQVITNRVILKEPCKLYDYSNEWWCESMEPDGSRKHWRVYADDANEAYDKVLHAKIYR